MCAWSAALVTFALTEKSGRRSMIRIDCGDEACGRYEDLGRLSCVVEIDAELSGKSMCVFAIRREVGFVIGNEAECYLPMRHYGLRECGALASRRCFCILRLLI